MRSRMLSGMVLVVLSFIFLSGESHFNVEAQNICESVSEISYEECDALVNFYTASGGPNWFRQDGWLVSTRPCTWIGVVCENIDNDYQYEVIRLQLNNNGLSGTLTEEIENLTALETLELHGNQLTGSIPEQIGNLKGLTRLTLSRNFFSGEIPSSIGNLVELYSLSLAINNLDGSIPEDIGNLTNLTELYMHANELSGEIPASIGDLGDLQELILYDNKLSGNIPAELGNLSQIRQLSLIGNSLAGHLPPELGNLSRAMYIRLSNNALEGPIPSQFGGLVSLRGLNLAGNRLEGTLPEELAQMISLEDLRVSANSLRGPIPTSISEMGRLSSLDLAYNSFFTNSAEVEYLISDLDPDWKDTQTIPPSDMQIDCISPEAIQLYWTPITYTQDGGFYEIWYRTDSSDDFSFHGTTENKEDDSYLVAPVIPATEYYFLIRTYTPAHDTQENELWSGYGEMVSCRTAAPTPTPTATATPTTIRIFSPLIWR